MERTTPLLSESELAERKRLGLGVYTDGILIIPVFFQEDSISVTQWVDELYRELGGRESPINRGLTADGKYWRWDFKDMYYRQGRLPKERAYKEGMDFNVRAIIWIEDGLERFGRGTWSGAFVYQDPERQEHRIKFGMEEDKSGRNVRIWVKGDDPKSLVEFNTREIFRKAPSQRRPLARIQRPQVTVEMQKAKSPKRSSPRRQTSPRRSSPKRTTSPRTATGSYDRSCAARSRPRDAKGRFVKMT
jgi:hypothetical protein